MNRKSLHEVWKRGRDTISHFFGSLESSTRLPDGAQAGTDRITLIPTTIRSEKSPDKIAEFVSQLLREDSNLMIMCGTGPAAAYPFPNQNVIDVGRAESRTATYSKIGFALSARQVCRIIAIPQSAEDLLNAVAASDATGAPLAVWITENYNLHAERPKSDLLDEALRKARLCFAASEPIRAEIQKIYGTKVWMMPLLDRRGLSTIEPLSEPPSPELGKGLTEWLWKSLDAGTPTDDRFELLYSGLRQRLTPYVDPPAPADIHWEMQPHFQALYRLKASGFKFDFVVDVGASTGYWSHIAQKIFPSSKYFLVEPLLKKYLETEGTIYRLHPEFVKIEAAAGNAPGRLEMNVSPDLYGSSFFDSSVSSGPLVQVSVRTLDEIAVSESIQGRGLLKIDAQFSEHLVLEGGIEFLKQVDVVFLEVSLRRIVPECKIFVEIVNQLHGLGFEYREYAGTWRDPSTGELLQQDAIFARHSV
jgi:FkbM family methyltransferase